MKKKQAEAAAEALLLPERQKQQALKARADAKSGWLKRPGQGAWRVCVLLGLSAGGVIGYFGYDNAIMGLITGFAVGSLVGALARYVVNRLSTP